jgi:uncharacterized protein YqgC (DUF456 family)
MQFLWATLLLVGLVVAWTTNIVGLPGNWLMLALAVLYWILAPAGAHFTIGSTVLVVMAALATAGEFVELAAGSAGVQKAGGSRRSSLYAILGSFVGGMIGLAIGFPIPIIGPLIGSLLFASIGAMAGAMHGERLAGRDWHHMFSVGKAAFLGRALGTLAKMALGLAMIAAALVGLLF